MELFKFERFRFISLDPGLIHNINILTSFKDINDHLFSDNLSVSLTVDCHSAAKPALHPPPDPPPQKKKKKKKKNAPPLPYKKYINFGFFVKMSKFTCSLARELKGRVVGFVLKTLFTHFEMLTGSYALHSDNGCCFLFYLF